MSDSASNVANNFNLVMQVCGACGLLGYYSHKLKAGICSTCKNGDNISTMQLPYACKLLIQVMKLDMLITIMWCMKQTGNFRLHSYGAW